jgi:predicted phosphodiesterase
MMNAAFGYSFGESKYRKQWKFWTAGREYERNLKESNIHARILGLSDLHVPYQLPISTFAEYSGRIDILVINGDEVDLQAISRFPKSYRDSPMEDIIKCRQYLIDLIEMLMPKDVYITIGNHDARMQSYLSKNLDSDLIELMPMTPLDLIVEDGIRRYDKRTKSKVWYDPLTKVFPDIKIHFDGDWKVKIGSFWFAHPFAFSSGNLKTAERTLDYFLKNDRERITGVSIGHTHRSGDMRKGLIYIFEQGACCHTEKMLYTDGRLSDIQQKGYVYITLDKNGDLIFDSSKRIVIE